MNFLLHRELALRDLDSPLSGLGAMLPDLWRMADRRVRATTRSVANRDLGPSELARGVEHHLEADRWFHAAEVFIAGERATSRALAELGVPKLARFAHVAWELCLDGALLLDAGFHQAKLRLQRDLGELDVGEALALAAAHGAAALDAESATRFRLRMQRIVEGLHEGSWIAGYQHGDGLAQRIEGLRSYLGLPALAAAAHHRLAEVLEARVQSAREVLPGLLAEWPATARAGAPANR